MTLKTCSLDLDSVLDLDFGLRCGHFALEARLETESPRVAIVGPSGAGKTTLLRVLAGLERAERGHVRFGERVWQDTDARVWLPAWQRQVGWVPQHALLYPHRNVRENLLDGAKDACPHAVASMLAIEHLLDRRPENLSGGERQRVALGRALLREPKLLLLDEPFSALDRELRGAVAEAVLDYCDARGLPLVLVSHDERDVSRVCEEVWEVRGGRVERRV